VHDSALIRQIGATRFNLKGFVDDVVSASGERDGDEYSIAMEQHGASQQIQEASGNVVKARPRYYLIGEVGQPRNRIKLSSQLKFAQAFMGTSARIKDQQIKERRNKAWKHFICDQRSATEVELAAEFERVDVPGLLVKYNDLFLGLEESQDPKPLIREILSCLNEIETIPAPLPNKISPLDEDGGNDEDGNESPARNQERRRVSIGSSEEEDDAWRPNSLVDLIASDIKAFATKELLLACVLVISMKLCHFSVVVGRYRW
jgi:hypothetical protein